MTPFAAQLRKAMNKQNLNQVELSGLSGVGKSSICQYLAGKNTPHMTTKEKLANALEVPVTFFDYEIASSDTDDQKNISVEQCANMIGKSKQFVRIALQRGLVPFGYATKVTGNRYSYHISAKKLNEYMGIEVNEPSSAHVGVDVNELNGTQKAIQELTSAIHELTFAIQEFKK
jgi:transcriptional regulator with XRE-family HTH domain